MARNARLGGWVILIVVFLLAGWYSFQSKDESSILILKKDQTFQQEITHGGKTEHAQGDWRRIGEGRVVFSREFLKLTGQETRGDGQADGEVKKRLGLLLSIQFDPDPSGPVFRKSLFR